MASESSRPSLDQGIEMFPTMYEDDGDRRNELSAKDRLEVAWKVTLRKLPKTHPIDFIAIRDGRIVAWVEYKKRSFAWGDYPTVIISVRKVSSLRKFSEVAGHPYFVVEDKHGEMRVARLTMLERFDRHTQLGGQTVTTRDPTDIEPVVMLPIARFKKVDEPM